MEHLFIPKTTTTPEIKFYPDGNLYMEGISVPENSLNFYTPIFNWLKELAEVEKEGICFRMYLEYLNTSSTRSLVDIIFELKKMTISSEQLKIIWQYEMDDDDMHEFGEELEILTKVKIEFEEVNKRK